MNVIQLAGHLGTDVETRFTPDGQKVSTIRVATNSRRGGKDVTTWWRVTLWGDSFDKLLPYLKKGSAIIVVGEFVRAEVYTDREGRQQISLEVRAEFLRFSPFGRSDRQGGESQGGVSSQGAGNESYGQSSDYGQAPSRGQAEPSRAGSSAPISDISEDDVPF